MKMYVSTKQEKSHALHGTPKASNQASIAQLLGKHGNTAAQREALPEEDELLQGKFDVVQRRAQIAALEDREGRDYELVRGAAERKDTTKQHHPLGSKKDLPPKKIEIYKEKSERLRIGKTQTQTLNRLKGKLRKEEGKTKKQDPEKIAQLVSSEQQVKNIGKTEDTVNNTGLPDSLKSGVEAVSGYSFDNVRVHYNSPKPAQLQALAYTQGTDIHIAPGQERHLPHEAWHVVQQMQGRVQPTMQLQGVNVNDDAGLEHEADVMGEKVIERKYSQISNMKERKNIAPIIQPFGPLMTTLGGITLGGIALGGIAMLIHDLYQRYKRYIMPAEETHAFLMAGGIHGFGEDAEENVRDHLDTLGQAVAVRNQRQDDTRRHLSPIGRAFSIFLRAGHVDIDDIIIRNITRQFPRRDRISEEEFESALQVAIQGATRTRGWLSTLSTLVGRPLHYLFG
ncbi:MAG: DUF4157 domain-containing protein [Dysgonamonadaceae bacterium]|jgi:BMFP domain-containing protein YqiC|nr:DUF4157 domain-containing protein [Dysgonamonadaceae bacterium]